MTLPVSHYLEVYQLRLRMAEDGVTHPNIAGRELIDQLVNRLAQFDPALPCHLTIEPDPSGGEWIAFVVDGNEQVRTFMPASTGTL